MWRRRERIPPHHRWRPRHLIDSDPRPSPPLEDTRIDTSALAGIAALVLAIVLLAAVAFLLSRVRRLERRLEALTRGDDGTSLSAVVETHLDKVYAMGREVDLLDVRAATLERESRKALQRLGIVRYNPFEDTGGNQSFVLALLDADGDGVVLTSLHTRQATRLYAKPVRGGRSDASLSTEEVEALGIALGR
jgi:hypothetical protein